MSEQITQRDLEALADRPDVLEFASDIEQVIHDSGVGQDEVHPIEVAARLVAAGYGRRPGAPTPTVAGDSLAMSATRGQVWAALEEVWDDGNAVGLDGWTGPGRGAGDVDDHAVFARERVIRKVLAHLGIEVHP